MNRTLIPVLTFLAGMAAGWTASLKVLSATQPPAPWTPSVTVQCDTVVVHDTLRLSPAPVAGRPWPRPVDDPSATAADTLRVVQRVYADTLCRAVVSGIDPRLDSLTLYVPVTTVSRAGHIVAPVPSGAGRRWSLGITAGLTATPRGLAPGIAVGVSYRLW